MNRPIFLLLFCLLANLALSGQTTSKIEQPLAIGSTDPVPSAMLDVQATDKGILIPRLTTAQRTGIASPATGLLVFDTGENDFFFRTAGGWVSLEAQALSFSGNTLNLSNGGGSVTFGTGLGVAGTTVSATDISATNEIQTLSLSGSNLSISSGNTVALPANICTTDKTAFGTDTGGDASLGIGTCPDNTARLLIKDTDTQTEKTGIKVNFTGQGTIRRGAHLRVANGSNTNDGIVLYSSGNGSSVGIVDTVISNGANGTATGARFVVSSGTNATGMNMLVENGSNTNDGIVLLSKGNLKSNGIIDSVRVTAANNTSSSCTAARLAAMSGHRNLGMNILVDDVSEGTSSGRNIGLRIDLRDNGANDANAVDTTRDVGLLVIAEDKVNDFAAWFEGNVGIMGPGVSATVAPLRVIDGGDASPTNSEGYIQAGRFNEQNIAIDNNEIMARNNGVASTLYLNHGGGDVKIGNASSSVGIGIGPTANPLHMASGAHCTVGGIWTNASDRRLKTDVADLGYGLGEVMALRPVSYRMIKGDEAQIGFIAQEVQGILPELISGTEGDLEKGETLGLSYGNLTAVLVKAMQEQQVVIEKQEERLDKMEKEMAEMKAMMQQAMRR